MAGVKAQNSPAFVDRLNAALVDALRANGIPAKVKVSRVPTTRLYRLTVLAPKFKQLRHSERQNLVWRITDQAISPEEQTRISMILTLTPDEAAGK